jgi:4-amino-4-deoxy-L-arabinose transferase-like glycosyltransferase
MARRAWETVSERGRWALLVLGAALLLVAFNAWWVATYRDGYPFDIDEAGYTGFAVMDYFGLKSGGIDGWWETIRSIPGAAPLAPALASLLMPIDPGILHGFAVLGFFLIVLALATYGIGERLAGPRLGALAALVVITSQGAFAFSHEFIFTMPAAALLACAVYAVLRSEGLQSTGWAIAAGVAIGLMLLARTMTIAFVPGIGAAALLALALRRREDWLPGLLNLAAAAIAAFAVAATWYWENLDSVVDYLTDYGYGARAEDFGDDHAVLGWDWWRAVATRIADSDLLLPLATLTLAGLIAAAVAAVQRLRGAEDRRAEALRLLGSDAFLVAVVFAAGYLALSTSQNEGNGFTFPLAVLLPPIAVIGLRVHRRALVPVLAALAVLAAVNLVAHSSLWDGASRQRGVSVPALGTIDVVDGVPMAVRQVRIQSPGPETRFDERDREWLAVEDELGRYIVEELDTASVVPLTAFGSHNRIINTNSLLLSTLQEYGRPVIPMSVILPEADNDAASYMAPLNDPELGLPGAVVTIRPNTGDFEPKVNQASLEEAARRSGFDLARTFPLPNGTELRVWYRPPATAP